MCRLIVSLSGPGACWLGCQWCWVTGLALSSLATVRMRVIVAVGDRGRGRGHRLPPSVRAIVSLSIRVFFPVPIAA